MFDEDDARDAYAQAMGIMTYPEYVIARLDGEWSAANLEAYNAYVALAVR